MFNISSIYPKKEGSHFDFDYYLNVHMPLSMDRLSSAKGFVGVSVERGIDIPEANIVSQYFAMCHYYFDALENFLAAFMPYEEELQGDIKNYTDVIPVNQIYKIEIKK